MMMNNNQKTEFQLGTDWAQCAQSYTQFLLGSKYCLCLLMIYFSQSSLHMACRETLVVLCPSVHDQCSPLFTKDTCPESSQVSVLGETTESYTGKQTL